MPWFGGFEFKGQGYEFYKYPEPETFPLNKALFLLRTDDDLRAVKPAGPQRSKCRLPVGEHVDPAQRRRLADVRNRCRFPAGGRDAPQGVCASEAKRHGVVGSPTRTEAQTWHAAQGHRWPSIEGHLP